MILVCLSVGLLISCREIVIRKLRRGYAFGIVATMAVFFGGVLGAWRFGIAELRLPGNMVFQYMLPDSKDALINQLEGFLLGELIFLVPTLVVVSRASKLENQHN